MVLKMSKRRKKNEHAYSSAEFHGFFTADQNNEHVYTNGCDALVDYVTSGKLSMMFAYGNTGSGKTHTILGGANEKGMYYMAAEKMCSLVQEANILDPELKASVRVQFAELHLNKAYDLLDKR